ncbi:hypothetical protein AM493_04190 [Flavobacterium akiainvivens]|uniref:NAD-dependent epimerase/dehydratase domain-containing protein n=1 Tax=Flavobacterium akiainvivens TaxID=1202724 RepID=A0A0M8MGV0_9FLAO|nr:NAD-dependent epimerase/dehydratase family protein [Flavobacterium akiainvivens]KOS05318.1 hypothetical protein AM493_04190 [Flavobacterium akiainvivens]SFQ76433.1 Nucleoside-diphosphate-sugar epimerase [Flavobacterium akiainvivens]
MSNDKQKPEIFITGATGYIGGTFLHLMLQRDYLSKFIISALVCRKEDTKTMEDLGIVPVIGTLDDFELLKRKSTEATIVFNMANCDHQQSAIAILQGLTHRFKQTNERPILIHTSGAGVLSENSNGMGSPLSEDPTAMLWDDSDFKSHVDIPDYAPHRHVDAEVFADAKEGAVKTYLMVPPTVFGKGLGIFAEKWMSIQIPRLVYQTLVSRKAMFVGSGENQWTNVHVEDLAEIYLLVLDKALEDLAPEGLKGIYYPDSEFFAWSSVANRIAEILYLKKIISNPVASSGLQPGWFWGSNVRVKSTNGKKLGWRSKMGGTDAMLKSVDWDVELMLDFLLNR